MEIGEKISKLRFFLDVQSLQRHTPKNCSLQSTGSCELDTNTKRSSDFYWLKKMFKAISFPLHNKQHVDQDRVVAVSVALWRR